MQIWIQNLIKNLAMEWFFNAYLSNPNEKNNIFVSPLKAPIDELRNLPDTLIVTDENDVLRDEGETFAHNLMNANVNVTSFRCLGTIHDFLILDALKNTPAVKSTISLIVEHLKKNCIKK
jgi:acetyl esterase